MIYKAPTSIKNQGADGSLQVTHFRTYLVAFLRYSASGDRLSKRKYQSTILSIRTEAQG